MNWAQRLSSTRSNIVQYMHWWIFGTTERTVTPFMKLSFIPLKLYILVWFDFIECFRTTFLRAHSWLNWVDEDDDEVGLNLLPSLGLRTQTSAGASSLRVPTGVWNILAGGRLQLGLRFWFPPDPRRRCCSTFLNLNWWTAFCMPW